MSRLCAKPTCSDPAVRWFDILAADRRVVERSDSTPSAISLCDSHAARFSAPAGWTIDTDLDPIVQDTANPVATQAPIPESDNTSRLASALTRSTSERPRRRKHDRDAPWFLAGSSGEPTAVPSAPLLPAVDDDDLETVVPTAGSLLHRAFHGPDRDDDVARAESADRDSTARSSNDRGDGGDGSTDVADVGDLTSRRAKQAESEGYDIELPFPPFEPARHVAVS